jgi:hypothetical protein
MFIDRPQAWIKHYTRSKKDAPVKHNSTITARHTQKCLKQSVWWEVKDNKAADWGGLELGPYQVAKPLAGNCCWSVGDPGRGIAAFCHV